jgi:hypothetical protein
MDTVPGSRKGRGIEAMILSISRIGLFTLALSWTVYAAPIAPTSVVAMNRAIGDTNEGSTRVTPAAEPSIVRISPGSTLGPELLARVRESVARCQEGLSNLIFHERIDRYKGSGNDNAGQLVDVINSTVSVGQTTEEYTQIYRNKKSIKAISGLSGAWSAGGYHSMLRDVAKALSSGAITEPTLTVLTDTPVAVLGFDIVNGTDSSWEFQSELTHYLLPFHAEVWVSRDTGDILRISRQSLLTPPGTGIKEVTWSIDFAAGNIKGKQFWLPQSGTFSVSYLLDNHREWNLLSLSEFRHFEAESVVRYQ